MTHEGDAVVEVVVVPLPLVAGNLDGQLGTGAALLLQDQPCRRPRHRHQDQQRNQRPDDLDGGVFVEVFRLMAGGLAMTQDGPEHHAEYQHEDAAGDVQQQHVQVVDILRDAGDRRRQIDTGRQHGRRPAGEQ
ncbi:hypothetical protein D3C85_1481860 [compost metagenome]